MTVAELQYLDAGNALAKGFQVRNAIDANRRADEDQAIKNQGLVAKNNAIIQAKQDKLNNDVMAGYTHLNPESPSFDSDTAAFASWMTERNPESKPMVDKFMSLPVDQKKAWITMGRQKMTSDNPKNLITTKPGETVTSPYGDTVASGKPDVKIIPANGTLATTDGAVIASNPIAPKPAPVVKSDLGKLLDEQATAKPGTAKYNFYQKKIDILTTRAPTAPGISRGAEYNKTKLYAVTDTITGKRIYKTGAVLMDDSNGRYIPLAGDVGLTEDKSKAKQRGGSQAAKISVITDMFEAQIPSLVALRRKISSQGLLPDTRFKDMNALNQWISSKSSNTDVNLLKGRVKLLADSLQKTIGAGGGEWSFKVADALLDPTLSPDAFSARLNGHLDDLKIQKEAYINFGRRDRQSKDTSGRTVSPASIIHNELPPAIKYKGKVATDNDTGKRYKSDGIKWMEVR